MTDPVQVVAEARLSFTYTDRYRFPSGEYADAENQAIVNALRQAGHLREGDVVGYAVVESFGDGRFGEWTIHTEEDVLQQDAAREMLRLQRLRHAYPQELRVATLELLPDTERAGDGS